MKLAHFANMTGRLSTQIAVAALTLGAGLAHAQSVTLSNSTVSGASNKFEAEPVKFGGNASSNTSLGAFAVNEGSGASFWVYCLDPLTTANLPGTYTKTSLSAFMNDGTVSNGMRSYTEQFASTPYTAVQTTYDDARLSGGAGTNKTTVQVQGKIEELYSRAYADSLTSSAKSAAFQFALWELEGENKSGVSYSRSTGGLTTTSSDSAFTNALDNYLTALNTGGWASIGLTTITNYTFTVYNSTTSQNLLRVDKTSTGVPEPGTLVLAGVALFGIAYTRRKSKASK